MTMPSDRHPDDDVPEDKNPSCMMYGDEPCAGLDYLASQYREREAELRATIHRLSLDLAAAEKWARNYEMKHGPLASEPRMPDFMIPF